MLEYLKTTGIALLTFLSFCGVLLSTIFQFVPNNPPATLPLIGVGVASTLIAFLGLRALANSGEQVEVGA